MLEEIPNFPQYLMDRHMNWHQYPGQTELGGRLEKQGLPGSGADFLDFHHQFLLDLRTWYDQQPGHDDAKLAPWAGFPQELIDAHSSLSGFQTTASDGSVFGSEDALGIYIEPVHDSVHGWVAELYDQPEFGGFDSCKYFLFHQWHGMVESWRQHWLSTHQGALKDVIDHPKTHVKDTVDAGPKQHIKEVIDVKIKDAIDNVPHKPKDKDAEVPIGGQRDPMVERLAQRVAKLEATRSAFIEPEERPEIG